MNFETDSMNFETDSTKPDNHYVNISDNSYVVKLYLRRHKDTIVSKYNDSVLELREKLNASIYNEELTDEELQIPAHEKDFDAPEFIYNLIHNEDIRMNTRSIQGIANKIRTKYKDRIDTENDDDEINDMLHEYIADIIIPLDLRLICEPEHNTPREMSRRRGAGKKRKKQSKKSKKKKKTKKCKKKKKTKKCKKKKKTKKSRKKKNKR